MVKVVLMPKVNAVLALLSMMPAGNTTHPALSNSLPPAIATPALSDDLLDGELSCGGFFDHLEEAE